jgi:hypothetical protein
VIRRLLVLATFGALLLPTTPAAGGPADWLCIPDTGRGAVPAGFVLEACVDGTGMTVRNSLDVPVLLTGRGMEGPVHISSMGAERETVLRLVHENRVVLVPGDVVRWSLGRGEASLSVSDLEPANAPAIVATLDPFLPREGPRRIPDAVLQAFADVVEPISDAVAERDGCLDGRNFLGAIACDVTTATAIAAVLDAEFSRGVAIEVAPAVLDRGQWAAWAGIGTTDVSGDDAVIRQAAVPPPAPPPPPAPASSSRSTRPAPAPAPPPAPAPAPAVVPAPSTDVSGNNGNGNGNGNGRDKWDEWLENLDAWLEDDD